MPKRIAPWTPFRAMVHCVALMHPAADSQPLTAADRAIVLVALVLPSAITWVYFIALAQAPAAIQQTVYAAAKSVQFALPLVWIWLVQRERPRWPQPTSRGLALGAAFGLAVAASMAALYWFVLAPRGLFELPAQRVQAKIAAFGLNSPAKFVLFAAF